MDLASKLGRLLGRAVAGVIIVLALIGLAKVMNHDLKAGELALTFFALWICEAWTTRPTPKDAGERE